MVNAFFVNPRVFCNGGFLYTIIVLAFFSADDTFTVVVLLSPFTSSFLAAHTPREPLVLHFHLNNTENSETVIITTQPSKNSVIRKRLSPTTPSFRELTLSTCQVIPKLRASSYDISSFLPKLGVGLGIIRVRDDLGLAYG